MRSIRHSTYIDDDLSNSGILGSLTDGLRDRQEKVRRFSMAALGELLFYISTQNEHSKDNTQPESPSKEARSSSGWQVNFFYYCQLPVFVAGLLKLIGFIIGLLSF